MSAFRRIGVYLGLAEEDDYADGAEYAPVNGAREYSEPQHYSRRDTRDLESRREIELAAAQRGAGYDTHGYDTHGYDTHGYDSGYDTGRDLDAAGDLHPSEVDRYHDYDVNYEPSPRQRITTLHPRTYNEAKTIGQQFRGGTPVIMNLSEMDDSDAKRLVDFAAGLTFGLHGSIERVTPRVFLLSPKNITVTAADKARIAEGGFYNQS